MAHLFFPFDELPTTNRWMVYIDTPSVAFQRGEVVTGQTSAFTGTVRGTYQIPSTFNYTVLILEADATDDFSPDETITGDLGGQAIIKAGFSGFTSGVRWQVLSDSTGEYFIPAEIDPLQFDLTTEDYAIGIQMNNSSLLGPAILNFVRLKDCFIQVVSKSPLSVASYFAGIGNITNNVFYATETNYFWHSNLATNGIQGGHKQDVPQDTITSVEFLRFNTDQVYGWRNGSLDTGILAIGNPNPITALPQYTDLQLANNIRISTSGFCYGFLLYVFDGVTPSQDTISNAVRTNKSNWVNGIKTVSNLEATSMANLKFSDADPLLFLDGDEQLGASANSMDHSVTPAVIKQFSSPVFPITSCKHLFLFDEASGNCGIDKMTPIILKATSLSNRWNSKGPTGTYQNNAVTAYNIMDEGFIISSTCYLLASAGQTGVTLGNTGAGENGVNARFNVLTINTGQATAHSVINSTTLPANANVTWVVYPAGSSSAGDGGRRCECYVDSSLVVSEDIPSVYTSISPDAGITAAGPPDSQTTAAIGIAGLWTFGSGPMPDTDTLSVMGPWCMDVCEVFDDADALMRKREYPTLTGTSTVYTGWRKVGAVRDTFVEVEGSGDTDLLLHVPVEGPKWEVSTGDTISVKAAPDNYAYATTTGATYTTYQLTTQYSSVNVSLVAAINAGFYGFGLRVLGDTQYYSCLFDTPVVGEIRCQLVCFGITGEADGLKATQVFTGFVGNDLPQGVRIIDDGTQIIVNIDGAAEQLVYATTNDAANAGNVGFYYDEVSTPLNSTNNSLAAIYALRIEE